MRYKTLPQVCCRCRQLKMPNLVKEMTGGRYNQKIIVCLACLEKPEVTRQLRTDKETPIEKDVREALQLCDVKAEAEFPIGPFIFDFAVPRLRLLIEVDSVSYHTTASKKKRDQAKTHLVLEQGWRLVRLKPSKHLRNDAFAAVQEALGHMR